MRRMAVAMMFAVFATIALASNANAVPSFVRQTGLTCNQCHITFSNVPDFTFTGKKFRLNGYRTPYVAEKIEAGEEGALSGNRLVMGIQNIFSLRFRNNLLSQSQSASDAAGLKPDKGPVLSQPGTSISWFYVGGIGEHIGLWNEFYFDATGNGSPQATPFRLEAFDEYDLKFVFNPGYDNIIGTAITTQSLVSLAGFSPFSSGAPNHLQRGGIGNAHASYVNLAAYGMIKDRLVLVGGVQTGEDNYSFSDGMNTQAIIAYAFGNTDRQQLWLMSAMKAGNDGIPIVSSISMNSDRVVTYGDAISGIAATRGTDPATGKPFASYTPSNTGDFIRTLTEVHYGFIDRGPHSLSSSAGFSINRETYDDGAEVKQNSIGARARYYYDRTYGVEYGFTKVLKYNFLDSHGIDHPINKATAATSITFYYRPAMNFSINVGGGISTALGARLDDKREIRNGWNWSIGYDFMF